MTNEQWQALSLATSIGLLIFEIYIFLRVRRVAALVDSTRPMAKAISQAVIIVMAGIIIYQMLRVVNGGLSLAYGDFTFEIRQLLVMVRDGILAFAFLLAFKQLKKAKPDAQRYQT